MSKKNLKHKQTQKQDWPVVVYIRAIGLFIATWFIGGEAILESRLHPVHRLVGLVGGLIGIPIGWLWYRWRGDVF
ncbi:MAG: hypothetical protein HZB19_17560 [Chloroflexi bacterium]|nr:hypothetical protein [Chloroflexota bacterium]